MLDAITYTDARKNLAGVMDAVCSNIDAVVITRRKNPPVVIMSLDEYNSIKETDYLLRSPENKKRLLESIKEIREGKAVEHDLIEVED